MRPALSSSLPSTYSWNWNDLDRDQLLVGALLCCFLLLCLVWACLSCTILAYRINERREIEAAQDKINEEGVEDEHEEGVEDEHEEGVEDEHEEGVEDEQTPLECRLSTEITKEAFQKYCGKDLTSSQLLSFAWSVVRAFGNVGLLTYTCFTIKPLQKDKPWDLEKHIVVYGEGLFSAILLAILIFLPVYFVSFYLREQRKHLVTTLVFSKGFITFAANFSFLKALPLAQPEVAWRLLSQAEARQGGSLPQSFFNMWPTKIGRYLSIILQLVLAISAALMSVSVKVAQLAFITRGMHWTPAHYFSFGLFINALAGLRGDMEQQRMFNLFEVLGGAQAFHRKLASQLLDSHGGLKALIVYHTMTAERIIELLIKAPAA